MIGKCDHAQVDGQNATAYLLKAAQDILGQMQIYSVSAVVIDSPVYGNGAIESSAG